MTDVKICGLTRREDLRAAVEAGADAVGVVSDVRVDSPREVDPQRARELLGTAPPTVTSVLVTMAPTTGQVVELVESVRPDAVQLHDPPSPRRVLGLAADCPASVLVGVDPEDAHRYDGAADAVVLDSTDDAGAGGTGRTHDWDRARAVVADLDVPAILAGGLDPDNVAEAVETVDPFAVDVASGVERDPGAKDHSAVERFVARAKRAGLGQSPDAPDAADAVDAVDVPDAGSSEAEGGSGFPIEPSVDRDRGVDP